MVNVGDVLATGTNMVTGNYTGDGAATQVIVGVGFQPTFLIIYPQATLPLSSIMKTNQDGVNAHYYKTAAAVKTEHEPDHIISLDADGFTVGDGTGAAYGNTCNINLQDYTYVAFGGSGSISMDVGTYTGDGAATQAIVGVGFQPKYVYIMILKTTSFGVDSSKTDQDGLNARAGRVAQPYLYEADQIISLDAGGFTVGDGSVTLNCLNIVGETYVYVAFG